MIVTTGTSSRSEGAAAPTGGRVRLPWLVLGCAVLLALSYVLARVVWLVFFLGLFFYLIAGLIGGAFLFRAWRDCRPYTVWRVRLLSLLISTLAWAASVYFEYQYVAADIASWPRGMAIRAALFAEGRDHWELDHEATLEFKHQLSQQFPVGGAAGYVAWAVSGGRMNLDMSRAFPFMIDDAVVPASVSHRGIGWLLRGAAAWVLLYLGIRWQLAALTRSDPVTVMIDPEEAELYEQQERHSYGDPCYFLFEHTADLGIEVRARKWRDVLEQAAWGLMACSGYLVPRSRHGGKRVSVKVTANSRDELLRDWLVELHFLCESSACMITNVRIRQASDTEVAAVVTLGEIDQVRSRIHREVKAVTYHELSVQQDGKFIVARVIVDI